MIPVRCRELVITIMDAGWNIQIVHRLDTGDNPYITVEGRGESNHVMVTWHTRGTGTYRMSSALLNKRDATLKQIIEAVAL